MAARRNTRESAWRRSLHILWDRAALFWSPDARLRRLCLGHRLLEAGRLPAARWAFAEAARRWPDEAEAVFGLGCVQHRLGRSEEAARLLERAAALARGRLERIPEGREALKAESRDQCEALTMAADGLAADLGLRRANLYLRLGDERAALAEYEALVARGDERPAVLNNLAWLYCTHGQGAEAARRARALAERARAREPWSDEVLGTLGAAQWRAGDAAAAVATLAPLVARRPDLTQAQAFLQRARAELEAGRST